MTKDFLNYFEEAKNEGKFINLYKTGMENIDSFMPYIHAGNMIIIGGRPAMGKSALCKKLVLNYLNQKKKVLYFALDETEEHFVRSLAFAKAKINPYEKRTRLYEQDLEKLEKAFNSINFDNLKIIDKDNLTVEEFEEQVKCENPQIIFLDYIQLLKMPKAPNLTEATNLAIREVKRITKESNALIFVTSQLSRAVEERNDKRPILSDLRNGSLLEDISDTVIMLYRDEYYRSFGKEKDYDYSQMELIFCKNKLGPTGCASVFFDEGRVIDISEIGNFKYLF